MLRLSFLLCLTKLWPRLDVMPGMTLILVCLPYSLCGLGVWSAAFSQYNAMELRHWGPIQCAFHTISNWPCKCKPIKPRTWQLNQKRCDNRSFDLITAALTCIQEAWPNNVTPTISCTCPAFWAKGPIPWQLLLQSYNDLDLITGACTWARWTMYDLNFQLKRHWPSFRRRNESKDCLMQITYWRVRMT